MSDDSTVENSEDNTSKKKGILPLLIGLVLAVAFGGAGFYLTYSGMLGGSRSAEAYAEEDHGGTHGAGSEKVAYVPIDPILVSLPDSETPRHLRFRAQIETVPGQQEVIAEIMPRILDVLNSYLRAVSTEDLERPTALIRLRAQMLRRIRLVADNREVRDLLVTEFVLN